MQQPNGAQPMEEDGAETAPAGDAELEPGEQPAPKRRKPFGATDPSAEQVACMVMASQLRFPHRCWQALSACSQSIHVE